MEIKQATLRLRALSQESRLTVFRLLVRCNEGGLSAGQISETTGIQPNTLSFHLKELVATDLIQSERNGRNIVYSLKVEGMRDLIHFLTEDCCQGRPEICTPSGDCC